MRRRHANRLRLIFEPLEARRLLAGIQVSVYVDHNGSRSLDASDSVAPNRLVYLDLNSSGGYDVGEPVAATGRDGVASFANLPHGTYQVGLLTNSGTQPQAAPVGVAPSATELSNASTSGLLVSQDQRYVWSLTHDGVLTSIHDSGRLPPVVLDGNVVATLHDRVAAWIVHNSEAGQQIVKLDLSTGQIVLPTVAGLSSEETVLELSSSGAGAVALIHGPQGNRLTAVAAQSAGGNRASGDVVSFAVGGMQTGADRVVGASGSSRILLLGGPATARTVTLVDSGQGYLELARLDGMSDLLDASLSADGNQILVARSDGVHSFALTEAGLLATAILAEAAAPLTAIGADGRFATGNRTDPSELIVWDSRSWQPIARSRSVLGGVQSFVGDGSQDRLLSYGASGVEAFSMAVATNQTVQVGDSGIARVGFGVQPTRGNQPPEGSRLLPRWMNEDERDTFRPQSLGITDPDGDILWFTIETQPQHGSLTEAGGGEWIYAPHQDYEGTDFATIVAFDGQTSKSFRIQWEIVGVNDPPLSITVDTRTIAEDSPLGTIVGDVSVVDVDLNADYRITTSDSRFGVQHGRLVYLAEGLDYETEPRISLQIIAVDTTNSRFSIRTDAIVEISNVIEAPAGIRHTELSIDEHELGAVAGDVVVVAPEATSDYLLSVSDARFEFVGRTLKLRADQQVDFEVESSIPLTILVTDRANPGVSLAATAVVTVNDRDDARDDAPTEIRLSAQTVEELVPGSIVGTVGVTDQDGEYYTIVASDPRFEVVDSLLKLRDDLFVLRDNASEITLTLTATTHGGGSISQAFTIEVLGSTSPWQNPRNSLDVNNDGVVTPLDVLIVINLLNMYGTHRLPPLTGDQGEGPAIRPDTSGDGFVSPLDALLIINHLNGSRGEGEQMAKSPGDLLSAPGYVPDWDTDDGVERARKNRIDEELEILLDQLSTARHAP